MKALNSNVNSKMDISMNSMSRLIVDDIHLKANRRSTGHLLSTRVIQIGLTDENGLFSATQLTAMKISFLQMKKFPCGEIFNKENDKIYAQTSKEAKNIIRRVQCSTHLVAVIVKPLSFREKVLQLGQKCFSRMF